MPVCAVPEPPRAQSSRTAMPGSNGSARGTHVGWQRCRAPEASRRFSRISFHGGRHDIKKGKNRKADTRLFHECRRELWHALKVTEFVNAYLSGDSFQSNAASSSEEELQSCSSAASLHFNAIPYKGAEQQPAKIPPAVRGRGALPALPQPHFCHTKRRGASGGPRGSAGGGGAARHPPPRRSAGALPARAEGEPPFRTRALFSVPGALPNCRPRIARSSAFPGHRTKAAPAEHAASRHRSRRGPFPIKRSSAEPRTPTCRTKEGKEGEKRVPGRRGEPPRYPPGRARHEGTGHSRTARGSGRSGTSRGTGSTWGPGGTGAAAGRAPPR